MKDEIKKILRESVSNETNDLPILEIINKYDSLKKALKFIILTNDSNYAPYHNLNHLLTVTKYTYNALNYMDMLKDDKTEALLLAALLHDYNHSMGEKKDDYNITKAKKGIKKFINDEDLKLDIDFIDSIIDATQYPYVIDEKDLDIYQKIIRDADMCQIFEYDWLKQNILGLVSEIKTTVVDFIPNQRKFLDSLNFLTDYGKKLHKQKFEGVMKEYEILEKIMG
jgi:hypothetical protein